MNDMKRAYEFFECATIVTANIVGKEKGKTDAEIQDLMNSLFSILKVFDSSYSCTHGSNTSIKNTKWKDYQQNANEWIRLAKQNFNQ